MAQARRYGIGEWFGTLFTALTPSDRKQKAEKAKKSYKQANQPCPFRSVNGQPSLCTKRGGICSLRIYEKSEEGAVSPAGGLIGHLVTVCPVRFLESGNIFKWIGNKLLKNESPAVLTEFNFLMTRRALVPEEAGKLKPVGKIDTLLVSEAEGHIDWCAVEMQAVYFSGEEMKTEFDDLLHNNDKLPFPVKNRRPDWRSSGPKRLMPQLQIKVPTLRRWGKKLAVVTDVAFFRALGEMAETSDIWNSDIAWFVVDYELHETNASVYLVERHFTTLESSIDGLVGGEPISKKEFEKQIISKLKNFKAQR